MSDLPIGWTLSTLEELAVNPTADIVDGPFGSNLKASEYQEDGIPIIRLQNVKRSRFIDKNIKYVSSEKAKELQRHSFVAGDLVITKLGDPLGEAAIVPEKFGNGIIVADLVRARLDTKLADKKYVMYAINSPEIIRSLETEVKGTTRPRVNLGHIRRLEIPLAPLNEQKRIVEKLDSLLARVDSCQTHLERVPQILKRFRQSVLAKAISGELTAGWRGTETTENWSYERAEDVCEKVQSGGTPREGFIDKPGIPFLKVYNIVDQKVDFYYRPQYITKDIQKGSMSKSQTKPGDVLMNIVGPPLGKVAIVPDEYSDWNINQAITLFRPNERITSKWIYYFLCSGYSIAEIVHETRGSAGQTNISLSQCRDFIFPIPPIEEQAEIVRRVEKLFAYAERLETRYTSASEHVERLTPSLLAKAFRGELVGQDAGDESAELLLERIQAARDALPAKAKRSIKSKEPRNYKMEETLEEIIQDLPKDTFSFEDLREKFSGDYETLKEQLFTLLNEENPIVSQVFDKSAEAMRFVRRKK